MTADKGVIAGHLHRIVPCIAVVAVFMVLTVASTLAAPQPVYANGGTLGGGGTSGGGPGGAKTQYGYGWYAFKTSGVGGSPSGLRNGGRWSDVQAACQSVNATTIIAFIIQQSPMTVPSSVVYNFQDKYVNADVGQYRGNNGPPWEPYLLAQGQYNSLGAYGVDTSGFTYGGPNGNVAWFCYDYQPPPWNVTPNISQPSKSTAVPGDTITWTHSVSNSGPSTSAGIHYGNDSGGGPFGPTAIGSGGTISSNSSYVITQNDVGKTVCRATYAQPKSSSDGAVIASGSTCVNVPYQYALTPTVTVNPPNRASVGTSVEVRPLVTNSGPTKSQATDWQVSEFVVSPGSVPPSGGVSGSAPCAYYKATVMACTSPLNGDQGNTIFDGSATGKVTNSGTPLTATSYIMPDLPVGSRVCFALSVKPNSNSDGKWRHSPPVCVVISKSPLVHILGGDLRVGAAFAANTSLTSQITTSVTIKTNKSYGSWGEYGIAASGVITGMASGSAYSNGLDCTINCSTSTLSFANTPTIGNFVPTTNIPNVAASFPVTSSTTAIGPNDLNDPSKSGLFTAGSNVTLNGGTINGGSKNPVTGVITPGRYVVINAPNSTVTIAGDIHYSNGPYDSALEIPQLIIIANQINIAGNVKNVDAWLVASGPAGIINTCSSWKGAAVDSTTKLASNICSDPLVINGPVMAKKLYLLRTAGADSGGGSDNPAEVINLRSDAYLWGIAHNANSGRLTTVYQTELPPRF